MRKGADCLSKWVGEAERQLRLLFEEARNCQPSIILFDEIDGLAPFALRSKIKYMLRSLTLYLPLWTSLERRIDRMLWILL